MSFLSFFFQRFVFLYSINRLLNSQTRGLHALPKAENSRVQWPVQFNSKNVANTLWALATMGTKPGERIMGPLEAVTDAISRPQGTSAVFFFSPAKWFWVSNNLRSSPVWLSSSTSSKMLAWSLTSPRPPSSPRASPNSLSLMRHRTSYELPHADAPQRGCCSRLFLS